MRSARPPRLATLIAWLAVPSPYREDQLGDLEEGFHRLRTTSPRRARLWYWRQALASIGPGLVLRFRAHRDRPHPKGVAMDSLVQDLRYGMTSLRKSPLFALVSTVTLALAIGVSSAVFSLVTAVLFADLPMQDRESVAVVRSQNPDLGISRGGLSAADVLELRERATGYESVAAVAETGWILTSSDAPTRVRGLQATANLLDTWRLPPLLGRDFAEGEDRLGAPPVALLSYPFWQARYGGSPDVLGETLSLDGVEHTIVGVTDDRLGFADFAAVQVITPLPLDPSDVDRQSRDLFVTARLGSGMDHARAAEETARIGDALADAFPGSHGGWRLWAAPVLESMMQDEGEAIMALLILTVTFVVLIACSNVANMLLARATARAGEMSIRAALGAGRGRLIRQVMTESMILSLVAGLAGLGFAKLLLMALVRISRGTEPAFLLAELDLRVLAFTLAVSLAAPLVFALFPALQSARSQAADALRERPRGGGSAAGRRTRSFLVGSQIALALTLMVVSGLLVRTVHNLTDRELGFDATGLTTVALELSPATYAEAGDRVRFYTDVETRLEDDPRIQDASLVTSLAGVDFGTLRSMAIEGRDPGPEGAYPSELMVMATGGYFQVTGIPIVSGRGFEAADDQGPAVAVLSREVARAHWPEGSPIGARIRLGTDEGAAWRTVVGVAGDVMATSDVDGPARNVYVPYAQNAVPAAYLLLRSSTPTEALTGTIRDAVWSVDPNQPVDAVQSFESARETASAGNYAILTLFVVFAVFALVMAAIGIYGVVAYSVSRRRSEIGLRMALGAEAGSVRRLILAQGLKVLLAGGAAGLLASVAVGRLLSGVVYGITPTDPATIVFVSALLGTVGLVANLVPAIRATHTDPAESLRVE